MKTYYTPRITAGVFFTILPLSWNNSFKIVLKLFCFSQNKTPGRETL